MMMSKRPRSEAPTRSVTSAGRPGFTSRDRNAAPPKATEKPKVDWAAHMKQLRSTLAAQQSVHARLQDALMEYQSEIERDITTHDEKLNHVREMAILQKEEREQGIAGIRDECTVTRESTHHLNKVVAMRHNEEEVVEREQAAANDDETERWIAEDQNLAGTEEQAAATVEAERQRVAAATYEETQMKSSTYGLSTEAAGFVRRCEEADKVRESAELKAFETEVSRRAKFSLYEELKGTIRVYCRVKGGGGASASGSVSRYSFGPTEDDGQLHAITVTQKRKNATSTGTKETDFRFTYDAIFDQRASQADVFGNVGPLVDTAVDGYRVCIFAYGQTGSGKTFTMEGKIDDPTTKGVIPRSVERIFSRIDDLKSEGWDYTVSCYFVEIYNDTIRDLLETSEAYHRSFAEGKELRRHEVKHDKESEETTLTGVGHHTVSCPEDVYAMLRTAVNNRSTAKTQMNERSSRSHCVFTVRIVGKNERLNQLSDGIMCLVDLAGSERILDSGVVGAQKTEAININKSLSYLGDCICALGEKRVPAWRNCRLTHLLQFYLGVKGAKLLMIVAVSSDEEQTSETLNSLRFAEKVNQTSVGVAKRRIQ